MGISRRTVVDGTDEYYRGLAALNHQTTSLGFSSSIQFQELQTRTNIIGNHQAYSFPLPADIGTISTSADDRVFVYYGPSEIDRLAIPISDRISIERMQMSSFGDLQCGFWDNRVHFTRQITAGEVNELPFTIQVPFYANMPKFTSPNDTVPAYLNTPFMRQALKAQLTENDQVQKPLLDNREDGAAEEFEKLQYKRNAIGQTAQRRGPATYLPGLARGNNSRFNQYEN